jgi:hypothetical protein
MEKNTVCIDIERYNKLIETRCELTAELIKFNNDYKKLQGEFSTLSVFAVRKTVKTYNLENYKLDDLLKFDEYNSAISKDDMNTLLNLGIGYSTIVSVIKQMKEEFEEYGK